MVFCVWHWSVGAKQAGFGIAVGKGNSSEEASAGGVGIPEVGVVALAIAAADELSDNGGRVRGA